ncbi:uncharacterized protein LOC134227058 [Armigeres subalbatus]|uniref:uncharacterized protein LOC134227058 n=1 Tax=Armigeres subalbatus TaxID=124917 RepID=UPI002ED491BA
MAYHWFVALRVVMVFAVLFQGAMTQGNEATRTSNAPEKEHSTQQSIRIFSLNDFLTHIGMDNTNHDSVLHDSNNHAGVRCSSHAVANNDVHAKRPMPQCKHPMCRSPCCVRRFLAKQLKETNVNINRLLECLVRSNVISNCPNAPRIDLNLSKEQDISCSDLECSMLEDAQSSENDDQHRSLHPCTCGTCLYKLNLPGNADSNAKSNHNKKVQIKEKPSIYHHTHSTQDTRFSDGKRVSSGNSFEDGTDNNQATKSPRRRTCRKTSGGSSAGSIPRSSVK